MATSSTMTTSNDYINYRIVTTVNSQSIANNTSNVTVSVQAWRTNSGYTTYGTGTCYCTINGTTYSQSITSSQTITYNSYTELFSKTVTISHSTDGSKTLSISAYISHSQFTSSSQSTSVTLDTIARASSISSVTSSVSMTGSNACTVSISRASTSFTHTVKFSFGSYSYSATSVGTSTSYTIPVTWNNAIPSATSGTATVTVTTYYDGSKVGSSVSSTFTVTVPSTVKPTFSFALSHVNATVPSSWDSYVQGKSKVTATISNAAGAYSSTISAYSITGGGYSGTSSSLTTGYLLSSGTNDFIAKLTDSRGRSTSQTISIDVCEYKSPWFSTSSLATYRCDADAQYTPTSGTYAYVKAYFNASSCNGNNVAVATVTVNGLTTSLTYGTTHVIGEGNLAVTQSYEVVFTVSDSFTYNSFTVALPSAVRAINISADGKQIAFGGMVEADDDAAVQIYGNYSQNNVKIPIRQFGRISITPDSADTTKSKAVEFEHEFAETPRISLTYAGTVPQNVVCSVGSVDTEGFTAYMQRNSATETLFEWIAIGYI